ncbi:MAG: hypothetical protein ACYCTB_05665 [bacterium]
MDKIDLSNTKRIIETAKAKCKRRLTKKEIIKLALNDIENLIDAGYTWDEISLVLSQDNIVDASGGYLFRMYHYFRSRMLPKNKFKFAVSAFK